MKNKICALAMVIVIVLSGNITTFAIEEHDEHEKLFQPVEIHNGMVLNVIDCVALAFKNSPKIRRRKYELDISKSNLGVARSVYFPTFGAGAGFGYERNSDSIYYDKKYRDLPAVGVNVSQLIWNFGKSTAFIKMEEFNKIAAEYEFMDALCQTLFEIKAKYYNLLRAKALFNVSKNNIEISEHILEISQNRNKPDLYTAQLSLSEAKVNFTEAENTLNNAKYDLSNEMYLEYQPEYDIENTPTFTYNDDFAYTYPSSKLVETAPFEPYIFPFDIKDAANIAYQNSPDLQVLINTRNAMEQNLKYVKRTYLPDLTADVGYGFNKTYETHNNSLAVGVNLSTSVNLMELKHSIKGADAQLNLADNEIILFKKDLYYELQRAFNNVERAKKQVPTAKVQVSQALKNLKVIDEKYQSQEIDYTSMQNARKDYISALSNYINSVYNYNIALIQVEMAMHYHLVDIHHKSEHAVHYHTEELIEHLNKVLECDEKEVKINNKRKIKH